MAIISQEQWTRIKNQGKTKYLLIHWVLLAAIPVSIIMPILVGIMNGGGIDYFVSGEFVRRLLIYILLCTLIALIAGNRQWRKNEKRYTNKVEI